MVVDNRALTRHASEAAVMYEADIVGYTDSIGSPIGLSMNRAETSTDYTPKQTHLAGSVK